MDSEQERSWDDAKIIGDGRAGPCWLLGERPSNLYETTGAMMDDVASRCVQLVIHHSPPPHKICESAGHSQTQHLNIHAHATTAAAAATAAADDDDAVRVDADS